MIICCLENHAKPKRSQIFPSLGTNDILCSNKCVQLLIFLLVLVMAFWYVLPFHSIQYLVRVPGSHPNHVEFFYSLIAMATLYMIEYQKRSSYEFHQNSHYLTNTSHLFPHDSQHPSNLGSHSSHAGIHSASMPTNTHSTKSPVKFPAKTNHGGIVKNAFRASIHSQEKPSVLGRPLHCSPSLYLNPLCKVTCSL